LLVTPFSQKWVDVNERSIGSRLCRNSQLAGLRRRIRVRAETAPEKSQAQTPWLLDREKGDLIRLSIDGKSDQQ
jgi:hypothetical protein